MDQLTYNSTYVKGYLKEIPYAAASIGISSFFLIAFLTYLALFVSFIISVKIRKSSKFCTKDEEEPSSSSYDHSNPQQQSPQPQPQPQQPSTINNADKLDQYNQSHRSSFSVFSSSSTDQNNNGNGRRMTESQISSSKKNGAVVVVADGQQQKDSLMNRNQKIIFFMVICLVLVQIVALCVRCVSDILSILLEYSFRQQLSSSQTSVIITEPGLRHQIATFFVFTSAELGLTFGNMITTLMIMCFVLNVFLTTCQKIGAIAPKSFKILKISIISVNVCYFIVASSIMFVISIGYLLARLAIVKDFLLAFYISIFFIHCSMIIVETVVFNIYGFKVVSTINKQAVVKSQREQKKLCIKRKRFAKIIVLQLGLSFCAILQVVAMILQTITRVSGSDIWETAHYFVNSFGILSFAIVVLMLYNPLLNYTEKPFSGRKRAKTTGAGNTMSSGAGAGNTAIDTDSVYSGEPSSPRTPFSFMSAGADNTRENVGCFKQTQFSQFLTVPGQYDTLSTTGSTGSLISDECNTPTSIISEPPSTTIGVEELPQVAIEENHQETQ